MTKRRLKRSLACYGVLALIALMTLSNQRLLLAVLVLMAGLAVMSYTAYLRERLHGGD